MMRGVSGRRSMKLSPKGKDSDNSSGTGLFWAITTAKSRNVMTSHHLFSGRTPIRHLSRKNPPFRVRSRCPKQ